MAARLYPGRVVGGGVCEESGAVGRQSHCTVRAVGGWSKMEQSPHRVIALQKSLSRRRRLRSHGVACN